MRNGFIDDDLVCVLDGLADISFKELFRIGIPADKSLVNY
jgi:hypothetical protein